MSQVPAIEGPILSGLPEIKEEAAKTAANIVAAAQQYLQTDEQLASNYERLQFDPAGTPGEAGGSGSAAPSAGGAPVSTASSGAAQSNPMSQLGQMMSMPMQMAQQAGQMPMQAMGAASQIPQGIMQGVQSATQHIGQMTEGKGKDDGTTEPDPQESGQPGEPNPPKADPDGTTSGQPSGERAPEAGTPGSEVPAAPSEQAVPDTKSHASPRTAEDPDRINL